MKKVWINFSYKIPNKRGHALVEAIIALAIVGAITYLIINTDIIPGLKDKWELQNNAIQNKWIE